MHALVEAIGAAGRPVEAIAINAGVGVGGPFLETELTDELNRIALNVTSAVHLAKQRGMVAAGRGRVLFTASIAAQTPGPSKRSTPPPGRSSTRSPSPCATSSRTPA